MELRMQQAAEVVAQQQAAKEKLRAAEKARAALLLQTIKMSLARTS